MMGQRERRENLCLKILTAACIGGIVLIWWLA